MRPCGSDLASTQRWRFSVVAERSPQIALRVLGLFAQRDLTPLGISAIRHRDTIVLTVDQDDLQDDPAVLLVEKIRAVVGVRSAALRPADDVTTS